MPHPIPYSADLMIRPIRRLQLIQLLFALGLVGLVARAAQLQLVEGERHAATAAANRTREKTLEALRGTIYDRKGEVLAYTEQVYRVGVAPNELQNREDAARLIASQLAEPVSRVRRRLRERWVHFHGPYTARQVRPLRDVRGVHLEPEMARRYPHPTLGRSVIGVPAEEGRPAGGIERELDSLLRGTPGRAVVLMDRFQNEYESPSRLGAFPVPGHDVYLTLDADLQEIVEEALESSLERYDAQGGDVTVLDPRTGEILALASRGGASTGALTSVFEPGSTAKLFAASALLRGGLADVDDRIYAEQGTLVLEHRTIRDEHPSGWLTLKQVIQVSSNIGMVKLVGRLTPEVQYEMLRDFGFGSPTGVEYPAEARGRLPRPAQWSGTTAAALAMGYEVSVTVLQLAQAYATIANDGVMLQPSLIKEVRAPNGKVVHRHQPRPVRRVVSPEVASKLKAMLRGVVYEGGTGETAALTSYHLAGKTGTSRQAGPEGYYIPRVWASFASIFPADDPQLVMVVNLDAPRAAYARATAAPLTRRVIEELLAARTGAIDRGRLTVSSVEVPAAPVAETLQRWVVPWPSPVPAADSAPSRPVPDVRGLTLRGAAKQLHQAGLRVRVVGWGTVVGSDPAPGRRVDAGTVVTVTARSQAPSP